MFSPMDFEQTSWVRLCTLAGVSQDQWSDAWLHLRDRTGGLPVPRDSAVALLRESLLFCTDAD